MALAVASTVVLIRALTERRDLDTAQGRIALGWLIVQDLFTVLVLVLLPTVAVLADGGTTIGQALIDVVVVIVKAERGDCGDVPRRWPGAATRALERPREGSRELFTLAVLAAAIGIAFVSYAGFGVSLALGAFLAGAVLAESDLSHQAASDALPLRDAFAVLFFVSVGMLVDPGFLLANPLSVLAVVGLVVGVNSITAFSIVVVLGYPTRVATTVGAGLAQVGEFTFVVAALGLQLGLLPTEGFQLAVAGGDPVDHAQSAGLRGRRPGRAGDPRMALGALVPRPTGRGPGPPRGAARTEVRPAPRGDRRVRAGRLTRRRRARPPRIRLRRDRPGPAARRAAP